MHKAVAAALVGLSVCLAAPAFGQDAAPGGDVPEDEAPAPPVPAPLSAAGSSFVAGMNAFAVDLYKAQPDPAANIFISPASVSTALALAYRGAAGETAAEMRAAMHYPSSPEASAAAAGEVLATMTAKGPGRELATANSIWVQQGLPLRRTYVDDLAIRFGAPLNPVDFRTDAEGARLRINAWVEARTRKRIVELLHPGDVGPRTKAVLVNALYLKAGWSSPFPRDNTRDRPFRTLDGRQVMAALMERKGDLRIAEADGVQAAALPYAGYFEMLVFLPKSPTALPRFERRLTPAALAAWGRRIERAPWTPTILTLPKFRLEWRADLTPALERLGLRRAFSDRADFSGAKTVEPASGDDNGDPIKIDNIIHQTFLDVDEMGSEAAAATAVGAIVVTGTRGGPPPAVFRADRPFLFLIRDTRTGAILFMGRMADPTARS
jgi:serpin B